MNWLTRVAIFFGRRKFEEFAQANPQLPDDALAVANTLDTHTTRAAVTLILGSLAHAADNVLQGTETAEQFGVHLLIILAGVAIILCRHAISAHDVPINDALQKARDLAGIPRVVKLLVLALGIGLATGMSLPQEATAQTSSNSGATAVWGILTNVVSDVGSLTKFSSGVGINLHAKIAPLLSQEVSLFGETTTNSSWSTGPSHATFFLPETNEEQLGWSVSGSWQSPPRILRLALFNARDIEWTVNWGLPAEDFYRVFRHVDWRENRFGVSVTRKF